MPGEFTGIGLSGHINQYSANVLIANWSEEQSGRELDALPPVRACGPEWRWGVLHPCSLASRCGCPHPALHLAAKAR